LDPKSFETGFAELRPPPSSPSEPDIFPSGSDRPFMPGYSLSVPALYRLCGRLLSLVVISAALSPHLKIPFLTDKAEHEACRSTITLAKRSPKSDKPRRYVRMTW
jgi:hypothetical protein